MTDIINKRLFGVDAKKIGGDIGYAGTAKRDLCKVLGIQTSFVKRGRPSAEKKREEDYVRQELARVRATRMEGSFGTQKEHYAMRRIKARKKKTEILYIFSASTQRTQSTWRGVWQGCKRPRRHKRHLKRN